MSKTTVKIKTKSRKIGFGDSNRLQALAREIRNVYKETDELICLAQKKGTEAIASAIACGVKLREAKEIVGHGGWEKWLAKHCKGVHGNTARNYMRLSKAQHVVDLKDCKSLRQAYVEVGIIPEVEPVKAAPAQPDREPTREFKAEMAAATPERANEGKRPEAAFLPPIPPSAEHLHAVPGARLKGERGGMAAAENKAVKAVDSDKPVCEKSPALVMWTAWLEEGRRRWGGMGPAERALARTALMSSFGLE